MQSGEWLHLLHIVVLQPTLHATFAYKQVCKSAVAVKGATSQCLPLGVPY